MTEPVQPSPEFSGPALAVALVGAAKSLADWWLDHADVSDGVLASWLMKPRLARVQRPRRGKGVAAAMTACRWSLAG